MLKPEESASTRHTEIMPMLPAMAVTNVRPFLVSRFLPLNANAVSSDMEECFFLYTGAPFLPPAAEELASLSCALSAASRSCAARCSSASFFSSSGE